MKYRPFISFYHQWDFLWDGDMNWVDFTFVNLDYDHDKTTNTYKVYKALMGFRITIGLQGEPSPKLKKALKEIAAKLEKKL